MPPGPQTPAGPGCPEAPGRRRASGPQTSARDVTCPSSPSPPPAWAAWSTPGLCCLPPSMSDVPGSRRATLLLGKRAWPRRPASGQWQVQGLRGRQQSVSESLVQAWGTAFIGCLRGPHPRNPISGCLLPGASLPGRAEAGEDGSPPGASPGLSSLLLQPSGE